MPPLGYSDVWDGDDFQGTFDGNGHTISHLTVEAEWSAGLFQYAESAVIKNIVMTDVQVVGSGNVGALVGSADNTTFQNISIQGSVTGDDEYVGGIAGQSDYYDGLHFDLTNLHFSGDISAPYSVGGLFGEVDVEEPGTEATVSLSTTEGSVSGDQSEHGGFIGHAYIENEDEDGEPDTRLLITDSYSLANVAGPNAIGGFIGYGESYNDGYEVISELVVNNSYFAGSVTAEDSRAGGIIGEVDNMSSEGENISLTNNFVSGQVSGSSDTYALLGNDGFLSDGTLTLENNYFDATATGQTEPMYDSEVGGWTAINTDPEADDYDPDYFKNNTTNQPFTDDEDDQVWDFDEIWQIETDGFPTLRATIPESGTPTDVNGDGIDDSEQPYVIGFTNGLSGKQQAIELSDDCTLDGEEVAVQQEQQFAVQDAGFDYANSFVRFAASCPNSTTVQVKVFYYGVSGSYTLRKHNPTTNAYFDVPGASVTTQTINGEQVLVASYQITDNGDLDLNKVDHEILDPVGLGATAVSSPNTGFRR